MTITSRFTFSLVLWGNRGKPDGVFACLEVGGISVPLALLIELRQDIKNRDEHNIIALTNNLYKTSFTIILPYFFEYEAIYHLIG